MSTLQGEGGTGVADDRPLSDREYQLLQRLLSDPFSLPIQFKTWLVSYLEASDMNLPISAINGLTSILGVAGVGSGVLGVLPAGIILPFATETAPTGSLICDGAAYLQTNYARLFAVIGNRYGAAPAGSFLVPDMRARIPVGLGPHLDHNAIGKSDGLPAAGRRVVHGHQVNGWHNTGAASGTDVNNLIAGDNPDTNTPPEVGGHDHGPRDGQPYPVGGSAYMTINFIIVA